MPRGNYDCREAEDDFGSPKSDCPVVPAPLQYVRRSPVAPGGGGDGYYWWRFDVSRPGGIVLVKGDSVYQPGLEHTLGVTEMGGEWAGPLPEPED